MSLEDQLAGRFKCPKCQSTGGRVKRISTAGSGISKLFDIQHNQFVMVSCSQCGFTEVYDPEVLEGKHHLGTILDILFGQ